MNWEVQKKNESLQHILTECSRLVKVWKHFREQINTKWNTEWSDAEMLYGPIEKNANQRNYKNNRRDIYREI